MKVSLASAWSAGSAGMVPVSALKLLVAVPFGHSHHPLLKRTYHAIREPAASSSQTSQTSQT